MRDLPAREQLVVEALPGLVVERVEVGVVHADAAPRELAAGAGEHLAAQRLVVAREELVGPPPAQELMCASSRLPGVVGGVGQREEHGGTGPLLWRDPDEMAR